MRARPRVLVPLSCALAAACGPTSAVDVGLGADGGVGGAEADGGAPAEPGEADVTVTWDPAGASDWDIDRRIFGRFQEHNGRDIYPGLYAQHVANGSFENWFDPPGAIGRTEELYRDTPRFENIAYPWQPRVERLAGEDAPGKPSWERPEGGVNGHAQFRNFQRVINESDNYRGGVRQRLALPDRRTLDYQVRVHVRGTEAATLHVRLEGALGKIQAEAAIPLTPDWEFHRVPLAMEERSANRYGGHRPFGEYQLVFALEGTGQADLDMAVLMSGDAVRGKYNPTTVAALREFDVRSMRWPGGNIASAYRWKDGIGPLFERPVANNWEWGGLEPNYFGTDEYLEFCEVTGMEPFINIGFNDQITPQEAAEWVEYVNGDASTPMGGLRAANGHPEPYDVTLWQIGNEVYGPYQIGHVDAPTFADGYRAYHDAMKAVDPSIRIIAAGIDPGYVDYGGNEWNEVLLERATEQVEAIDIHRYVNGIADADVRDQRDPVLYNQALVAFPTQFEALVGELRASATERGVPDLEINVGEWNLQPKVTRGWPRAGYPTMANAAFVAGMYNVFLRQGDAVRYAYQRDNNLYFRAYPIDTRPVNPGSHTLGLYSEPFEDGARFRSLPLQVAGPTFDIPKTGARIRRSEDVPLVDAAAIVAADGERALMFLVNRDLEAAHTARIAPSGGAAIAGEVALVVQASDGPFTRQTSWTETDGFDVTRSTVEPASDGTFAVRLPAAAVARVEIPIR